MTDDTDPIKLELQRLIESEDKRSPLTDVQLVDCLKSNGLDAARRYVTKCRQKMGIASSRQRRDCSS